MGKALGFHKLLRQRGDLYPRLINIAVNPVARRLVGGKAGDALNLFLGPGIARQAGGKGVEPVVSGQTSDGCGAEVEFR